MHSELSSSDVEKISVKPDTYPIIGLEGNIRSHLPFSSPYASCTPLGAFPTFNLNLKILRLKNWEKVSLQMKSMPSQRTAFIRQSGWIVGSEAFFKIKLNAIFIL